MGVEIIHDQGDALTSVARIQQVGDFLRPVRFGALCACSGGAPAGVRFREHEDTRGAVALIFIIYAGAMRGGSGQGRSGFQQQLVGLFIHTHQRLLRIHRLSVRLQHLFHPGDKLGILLGWDYPVLHHALGHPVSFQRLAHRFRRNARHNLQFDQLTGQQAQGPVAIAHRRFTQSHRDQARFPFTIQLGWGRRVSPLLAVQGILKPFRHQPLPELFNCSRANMVGRRNLSIGPARPVDIRLQQHVGPPHFARTPFQLLDHFSTLGTFCFG